MKSTVVRSPWLALALVLSLCLSLSFASWDAEDEGRGSRRWQEGGDERRSGESGRPYHFGEESFREWAKSRHGHFKVLERFDHELLRGSIGDYRVACLDAAPRAFLQPSHYDADEIAFVREGEGVLVLLRNGKRESFCVREGDVFVIPAGSIVYSANTHRSKWFRGSMTALRYTTRSTRIYIVVEGRDGYFEMACPHVSSSGRSERREHEQEREREHGHGRRSEERGQEHGRRSEEEEHGHGGEQEKSRGYRQVRAQIKVGSVIVLPAGHPATFVAGNEGNLALLSFGVGANNDEEVFVTGGNSVLKQLDEAAKALAFPQQARELADRVIRAQPESVFVPGPQQQRRVADM
ncbi:hypothetical protein VPH35_100372 [Triticum aestivum]